MQTAPWNAKDVPLNRFISAVGFSLGGCLTASLMVIGAELFAPREIEVQLPGTAVIGAMQAYGKTGLLLALLGIFFGFAGATIENCLSVTDNICQFYGWRWGKRLKANTVPRFTAIWLGVMVLSAAIVMTGVDPVQVVEYAIVFSVVIVPLSYYPILRAARNRELMGSRANGWASNILGIFFLVLVTLAALAAIPLLVITHSGKA